VTDVLTIGAYGWSADAWFAALRDAGAATLCDVRRRRGVRGPEYAFANSARLQARLADEGVAYVHRPELSPSAEVREAQAALDATHGIARRARTELSPAFVAAYERECLTGFDADAFLAEVGAAGPVCLFCVEREPAACHRSLLAARLGEAGARVSHLLP
jgi:uncharacterized protein (DUF488 family)